MSSSCKDHESERCQHQRSLLYWYQVGQHPGKYIVERLLIKIDHGGSSCQDQQANDQISQTQSHKRNIVTTSVAAISE